MKSKLPYQKTKVAFFIFFAILTIIVLLNYNIKNGNRNVPLTYGKITTNVDGFDVKKVALWSTTQSNRVVKGHLVNDDKVEIIRDENPYYLIKSVKNNSLVGFCQKGFVILNN
jgi:hypothetical protein